MKNKHIVHTLPWALGAIAIAVIPAPNVHAQTFAGFGPPQTFKLAGLAGR